MKKIYFLLLASVLTITACKKKEQPCSLTVAKTVAPANEKQMVLDYLSANSITGAVELENSGMQYLIINPGSSERATLCSFISISYVGKLTNGTIFDQGTTTFPLNNLIEGWKRGIPLVGEGGKIRLFVPPSLAYGGTDVIDPRTGNVVIPRNSVLIFDIDVLTINN